jgi:hypothetical protein
MVLDISIITIFKNIVTLLKNVIFKIVKVLKIFSVHGSRHGNSYK